MRYILGWLETDKVKMPTHADLADPIGDVPKVLDLSLPSPENRYIHITVK